MGEWQISRVRVTASINGRVESGRVCSKMVKLRVDMRVYTEKFQFFNVKYHAIIEIVECESGRVAKKWSSASRLCEYAGTRPFPISNLSKIVHIIKNNDFMVD